MLLQMRLRLSVMMFLEYFIWGVWYVTLGTWLGQQLHFSGKEIGLAAGTTALGAMLSPFLVGLMADEWFATQRLLAALHGIGGVLLWVARATGFVPKYPPAGLLALLHADDGADQFPFLPPDERSQARLRIHSGARHSGMDRGGIAHRFSARRVNRHTYSIGRRRFDIYGGVLSDASAHAAVEVFRWWRIQAQQHFSC